jgi:nitrogen fixation/metabolism regulation signal transduction histidine kinase
VRALLRPPAAAALLGLVIAGAGLGWETLRFGEGNASASGRLEAEVRDRIASQTAEIRRLAEQVAADLADRASHGPLGEQRPALFAALSSLGTPDGRPVSASIYLPRSAATGGHDLLAWSDGPAEDVSRDRLAGPEALFVAPGTAGHRLVFVRPIDAGGRRVAAVAAETTLSRTTSAGKVIDTSFGPVAVLAAYEGAGAGPPAPEAFVIVDESGRPFLEVKFSADEIAARRVRHRQRVIGAAGIAVLGAALLAVLPGLLVRRGRASRRGRVLRSLAAAAVVGGSAVLLAGLLRRLGAGPDLVGAGWSAAAVGVAAIASRLLWRREHRRDPARAPGRFAAEHLASGIVLALVILALARYLTVRVTAATLERWQIALFPFDPPALLFPASVFAMELALCWAGVMALVLTRLRWQTTRAAGSAAAALLCWLAPTAVLAATPAGETVPLAPAMAVAAASVAVAYAGPWLRWRYRRTSQAARLLIGFAALVVPLIVVYPMSAAVANATARRAIEGEYAPAAAGHQTAQRHELERAQREIDRLPELQQTVIEPRAVDTQAAFDIWRQTSLAETRVASDVELYAHTRELVSRFALNLPQYITRVASEVREFSSCHWVVYGEVTRFGATNRLLLRAERALCGPDGTLLGAIVVHVAQDDYGALPFVPTANAYVELLGGVPAPAVSAPRDLELVVYGWSLQPIFTSGRAAWPITNELFTRIYQTGTPFWTVLSEDDRTYNVYFAQNRSGIFALGYPTPTLFEHTARLAEIVALAGVVFVLAELAAALAAAAAGRRDAPVRVLLREVRRSFHRKLFLFFVLAAVGPVVVLALLFGGYLTAQLRAEVDAEASSVVTVARRVFEELGAAAQHPDQPQPPPSDDLMVWIRQVIHQDVNFFDGASLVSSSQRDLFDSGLLPTRTPAAVYRAIVIDRLPAAVVEHQLGGVSHLLAATPVVSHGPDAVLSVPLAPRQREIEREIQDLTRSVLVGAVLVVLLAAGLGAWAARRVSDPVARLSRATRQIAQGRLDITIAADTADELRRLIDDFNRMTSTLRAQRAALARTNQLKAWNEMARQVAHEIKNPLTPIQLAAEHLQRVHADRGAPLGAPFDQCLRTILEQVRLLRQIASEFANFSGELVARPESLALPPIVESVIAPYRLGLAGRVRFDVDVPATLPAVTADRTLLSRALTNLVENAVQAMPDGGALAVTAAATDDLVVLEMADTGVGMSAEAAEQAFQPYFSTKTGGSGLGLPNARRNVELGGGAVSLTSSPGAGTTVTVSLPRADRSGAADSATAPPR